MNRISKLTCLSLVALGLSSCSYTQSVLQGVYDEKADNDCQDQIGDQNSIHNGIKSSCYNGRYDPDGASWDPNDILKKESDRGIDVEDVTPSE